VAALGLAAAVAAQKPESLRPSDEKSNPLRQELLARVKAFAKAKEEQSEALAAKAGGEISPEFRRYFEAAVRGDGETVTNMYESFKHRHPQYEKNSKVKQDESLRTRYWSPVLEICLIYWELMAEEPKYLDFAAKGMVNSIPPGSIYFGGTDPGRGIPTAFSKSHADGDPFFTITQNALADGTYLQYLRDMYGGRIYTPTEKESQDTFQEYLTDVQKRLEEHKLKPGEDVKIVDNRVQVQGQVAVMSINALLTKIIFDKNPDREFYLEESFPLDWMYPHLEPHGLIMKINRQPSSTLSDAVLQQDRKYWSDFVDDALGDWLKMDTSVADVAEFAEKTHVRGDLNGFKGDPRFIRNDDAKKMFSKFRASIAGVYAWRAKETTDFGEKARMTREADFAFRQAWALCPYSPEACFRWVNLLVEQQKRSDAAVVAETTARMPSLKGDNGATVRDLVRNLKDLNVKTAP
jgi:hypothetical protein